ncbi:MAG: hypothetical protein FWB72_03630 [Firmicutes bacterium]|nr:hypothetical protein [Bacillota bacterium]
MRIWAKIIDGEKIVKDAIYTGNKEDDFFTHLSAICTQLDIATPILMEKHIDNFYDFNHVKFRQSDFLEEVTFDSLILEDAEI